jgi:hypothetical protein
MHTKIIFGRHAAKVQHERHINTKDEYIRAYFAGSTVRLQTGINWLGTCVNSCFKDAVQSIALLCGVNF